MTQNDQIGGQKVGIYAFNQYKEKVEIAVITTESQAVAQEDYGAWELSANVLRENYGIDDIKKYVILSVNQDDTITRYSPSMIYVSGSYTCKPYASIDKSQNSLIIYSYNDKSGTQNMTCTVVLLRIG